MAVRSLIDRLRKKRQKALSPQMRDLIASFEAQYGKRDSKVASRSTKKT